MNDAPAPTPLQPWDQQPGEPDAAFAAFQCYLHLGPKRSAIGAAETQRANAERANGASANGESANGESANGARTYSTAHVSRLCRVWHWRQRAAAWDAAHPAASPPSPTLPDLAPWDQQPDESSRWYRVFCRYLELGPARNIHRAVTLCLEEDPASPPIQAAYLEARRRKWPERAEAWDLRPAAEAGVIPSAAEPLASAPINPWDIQPGEPTRAYGFFCHYLELGPTRTVGRAVRDLTGGPSGSFAGTYYVLARRWQWDQRAAAWDACQRDRLATRTLDLRTAYAERRLAAAAVHFDQALDAFDATYAAADIDHLDHKDARRLLPSVHRMFVDAAALQRQESDHMQQIQQPGQVQVSLELLAAVAAEEERLEQEEAARRAASTPSPPT